MPADQPLREKQPSSQLAQPWAGKLRGHTQPNCQRSNKKSRPRIRPKRERCRPGKVIVGFARPVSTDSKRDFCRPLFRASNRSILGVSPLRQNPRQFLNSKARNPAGTHLRHRCAGQSKKARCWGVVRVRCVFQHRRIDTVPLASLKTVPLLESRTWSHCSQESWWLLQARLLHQHPIYACRSELFKDLP